MFKTIEMYKNSTSLDFSLCSIFMYCFECFEICALERMDFIMMSITLSFGHYFDVVIG